MRAWEEFLQEQERELGRETVQKWLRPLKLLRFDACNLYLEAEDSFKALWFEEHLRHKVQRFLLNSNHKKIKVHISVAQKPQEEDKKLKKSVAPSPPLFRLTFDELENQSRFTTYLTSDSNLLGYKILAEAAQVDPKSGLVYKEKTPPKPTFNPIYIFGRSGTGKSHLLMSVAHALREQGLKAIYTRAESFTEHVVNAIRTGEMQTFRKTYRNIDALLIDDIEIFSKKSATQEEFFHTFNTLHVEGKQIIVSASLPPQELKYIEPRLISRFEWGVVVPIQRLEREKMEELLYQKCSAMQFPLLSEVADFLLSTFGNNTKSTLRALDALILRTHLQSEIRHTAQNPLPLSQVKKLLGDLIQEEEKALLTPAKIIRTVAEFYGIRMDDILSKSQSRECALPRQLAMHLCRYQLNLPFMKIGDIFARDHSTVMSSVKQVQKGIEEKNPEIAATLNSIVKKLEGG